MSVRIITGDCRDALASLPEASVHCCVTSPPYFGLRDYGTAEWKGGDASCDHAMPVSYKSSTLGASSGGRSEETHRRNIGAQAGPYRGTCGKCGAVRIDSQLGLESTSEEYVGAMIAVFREVRRVLRDDGTLWLNIGDSYAASNGAEGQRVTENDDPAWHSSQIRNHPKKAQQMATVRASGVKPKDLYGIPWLLAFALRADGWYLRQDIIWSKPNPMPESITDRCTKAHEYLFLLSKGPRYYYDAAAIAEKSTDRSPGNVSHKGVAAFEAGDDKHRTKGGLVAYSDRKRVAGVQHKQQALGQQEGGYLGSNDAYEKRNKRSVWTVATQPFSEAHFATFPPALIEPCIVAGCPVGGTVIDPFAGAGTTGLVADRLQREAILIELNRDYAAMARRRIDGDRGGLLDGMEAA